MRPPMACNRLVILLVILAVFGQSECVSNNRPPQFLPGGDMARFSISEDTPVGKSVYKLSAIDPEGSRVSYTVSGQYLNIDRSTGVVTLAKRLDRETLDSLEVVISVTGKRHITIEADEPIKDSDANTVSLRREISIIDVNDNPPEFLGRPYSFSVSEDTRVGTIIYSNVTVVDKDIGSNSEITMTCIQNNEPCVTFNLLTEKVSTGTYVGSIRLARPLDFDTVSSYKLTVKASDGGLKTTLSSTANISVVVKDVQDERPVFTNSPYSIVIDENTPAGVQVLKVNAEDGDAGFKRPVVLSLEDDSLGYFTIENVSNGTAYIFTSDNPIDRENKVVSDAGGIYTFRLKATELINNELPGDVSYEIVTVVVQDVDDEKPEFNERSFTTSVSEDISIGTPLPGLNIIVNDKDLGDNGRYVLVMRTQDSRVSNWFKIIPETALGRSTVLIRLIDNDGFDYDAGVTDVEFDIVAMYQDNTSGGFKEASAAHVQVNVLDANDNLPKFAQSTYAYSIPENFVPGTSIANLTATDIDSGINGEITYSLQGFGMDKFGSDPEFGGIYLTGKVDYEQQSSYSLTLEAKDGGNRSTHVVILVEIVDVNDNTPVFSSLEYKRTIREGGTEFQPKFFVQASDADSGLNSMIRYSVASSNYDGVVMVNPISGELTLNSPVNSSHTSRGQYEVVVRATDLGIPPLHADANLYVRVGVPGNQRPMFKNLTYSVTIPENTPRTMDILRVRATDPDGPDHLIEYSMVNSNDNFHINKKTGAISVSERAILDLDSTGLSHYHLVVMAMDSGLPIREVAHADVYVNVTDVNNKPPKFDDNINYIVYVPEITKIGEVVYKVNAVDPDKNASIKYAIVEPIKANDKTGLPLKNTSSYNFKDVFSINKLTGEIKVNSALSYQMASVIVLTIRAVDMNAVENVHEQYDEVEITFFVKPYMNKNPVFTNTGLSTDGDSSTLIVRVDEETPIGTELVQLKARDVLTNESLYDFKAITAVPRQIAMDYAGKVILTERLDYETLEDKTLTFQVKVTTEDGERSTSKTIVIEVQDINDNSPEFEYPMYRTSLVESSPKGTVVLSVRANDKDLPTSQNGIIRYHLGSENSNLFTVDPISSEIKVSGNGVIDREKTPILKLMLFASDTPQGGPHQKMSSVPIHIDVKDINDNAPQFDTSIYIAVVLENVVPETSVLNVSAHDPDEGSAGLVHYKLIDEQQLQGFLYINPMNGQIKTSKRLTGKGRSDPYEMKIRAEDNGEPGMFSDVKLSLYISDIIENDGVPTFVHPTADEIAYVSENASIGSLVFRALATDPDDPNTLEGTIHYSFLEETKDSLIFSIDSETGLITTKSILDREIQDKYTLVLVAKDLGDVPQQSTKVFNVIITDIDDNKPVFNRSIEEKPLMMEVEEESSQGTLVGSIAAYDPDIGDNALIDYIITDGNEVNIFYLNSSNNVAEIRISGEIDRESVSEYVLTIKCFKHKTKAYSLHKSYNKQDPSERQVVIKVLDIDDNLPKFIDENLTLGVRVSVPLDTLVATIQATDVDSLAEQITYHITNLTFAHRLESPKEIKSWPFFLDQLSGQIRTTSSMTSYSEGYFNIVVAAINSDVPGRHSNTTIKVFIVKDRGLLKFVFTRPPNVVGHYIKKFKEDVEKSLGIPQASLNLYDTQFYSKNDGSLDFSSTGSCFQLVGPNNYNPKDTISLLEDPSNHELKNVYKQYEVKNIERCSPKQVKSAVTWVQISVLGIAIFIGFVSIFSICLLCCSYKKWKRLR